MCNVCVHAVVWSSRRHLQIITPFQHSAGHTAEVDEPRRPGRPVPQAPPTPKPAASVRPVHVAGRAPPVLQQEDALGQSCPSRVHRPGPFVDMTQQQPDTTHKEPNTTQQRPRQKEVEAQHATTTAGRQRHSLDKAAVGDGVAGVDSCAVSEPSGSGERRAQLGCGTLSIMPREVYEGSGGAAGGRLPVRPASGSSHRNTGPHLGPAGGGGNSCSGQQGKQPLNGASRLVCLDVPHYHQYK